MDVFMYKHTHFLSTKHKPLLVSASSRACRHVPAGQKGRVLLWGTQRVYEKQSFPSTGILTGISVQSFLEIFPVIVIN